MKICPNCREHFQHPPIRYELDGQWFEREDGRNFCARCDHLLKEKRHDGKPAYFVGPESGWKIVRSGGEEERMFHVGICQRLCGGGPVDPDDPDGLQYCRFPADYKEAEACGAPYGEFRRICEETRRPIRIVKEPTL